jgi:hypothetical protein
MFHHSSADDGGCGSKSRTPAKRNGMPKPTKRAPNVVWARSTGGEFERRRYVPAPTRATPSTSVAITSQGEVPRGCEASSRSSPSVSLTTVARSAPLALSFSWCARSFSIVEGTGVKARASRPHPPSTIRLTPTASSPRSLRVARMMPEGSRTAETAASTTAARSRPWRASDEAVSRIH